MSATSGIISELNDLIESGLAKSYNTDLHDAIARLAELERTNNELAVHLDKTISVAADAIKRAAELERENAELRELRRVSFMQMLAVLRQCSDRLEIFNSSFSDIDPLSDTIVQYRSDANDSFVLERRAALAGSGEK